MNRARISNCVSPAADQSKAKAAAIATTLVRSVHPRATCLLSRPEPSATTIAPMSGSRNRASINTGSAPHQSDKRGRRPRENQKQRHARGHPGRVTLERARLRRLNATPEPAGRGAEELDQPVDHELVEEIEDVREHQQRDAEDRVVDLIDVPLVLRGASDAAEPALE